MNREWKPQQHSRGWYHRFFRQLVRKALAQKNAPSPFQTAMDLLLRNRNKEGDRAMALPIFSRVEDSFSTWSAVKRYRILGASVEKSDYNQFHQLLEILPKERTTADVNALTRLARNGTFFANLDDAICSVLCKHMLLETYTKDEIIYNQNDLGDKFYLISAGSVMLSKQHEGAGVEFFSKSRRSTHLPIDYPQLSREIAELVVIRNDIYQELRAIDEKEKQEKLLFLKNGFGSRMFFDNASPSALKLLSQVEDER